MIGIILMLLLVVGVGIQLYYNFKNYYGSYEASSFEFCLIFLSSYYVCVFGVVGLVATIQITYEEQILLKKQIKQVLVIENSENLTLKEKEMIIKRNEEMHKVVFE